MEHRSVPVAARLSALCLAALPLWLAAATPEQEADWSRRLEQAAVRQDEGKKQRLAADQLYAEKEKACYKKFRVNACRDSARLEHAKQVTEARRVENEGKALEREVKKEQLAERDARHAAEIAEREAGLAARATDTAAARAQAEAEEAEQRADKAQRAEEGARRHAAEAARLQKKRAEHEAKVAEKLEKARRRDAESGGK